ncbi:uncharacterized mitochondrial protein AtMg00860-like [Lactuca sativa]|uniref:uncharacterized mitochondrial protein AtMg00860-like n=1 Tax=Lactuca sativa TaxID=4236 RepID=UPI000CD89C4C|nr:uncharacterized mitochondrial protein AtMg00860-like [Lactuca sativa]
MEKHEEHLHEILGVLRMERLYAKFSKCEFWLRDVQFLRHLVNQNGILVEPAKIEAVMQWEVPKSPSKIRSFLDLEGYYRRFIREFSKTAVLLTKLMRNDVIFRWGLVKQASFETLWQRLCEAPIGHVIAYDLRQLKSHEMKYPTHDLELGMVVFAFKI